MNKKRISELIRLADEALNEQVENVEKNGAGVSKILVDGKIDSAYNGSVASLGVSVAMCGLLPTLVIYYQEKAEKSAKTKANRRSVLDVISRMIHKVTHSEGLEKSLAEDGRCAKNWDLSEDDLYAEKLVHSVIKYNAEKSIKPLFLDCAIALKQVVRTYNLE